jgi:hypothetical protein
MRERRGSYNGFCCRLYPFICWIIIKEGPGNFSGGRSPHWVNHVNLCLSCVSLVLCVLFNYLMFCFFSAFPSSKVLTKTQTLSIIRICSVDMNLCVIKNEAKFGLTIHKLFSFLCN